MCGIAGFLASQPRFGGEELASMAAALARRGPDGSGWKVYDLPDGRRVGLAHARLALVDLTPAGAQPMERGDLSLVLNGEVYDHRRLRGRLEREGRRFRSRSDAEVLLALWEEDGPAALEAFLGMFAFALLDRRRGDLFLARDLAGKKPLHLAEVPGALVFASELRAIERFPGFRREIDGTALREYLAFGYVPWPRTIYAGARKLPPGTLLRFGPGGTETRVERDFPPVPEGLARLDGNAFADRFDALLADAVALRLEADVPAGVFLSGGIDSSLVAAHAAAAGKRPLRTFALALPESPLDESDRARAVAAALGAEHEEVPLREADLAGWIDALPEVLDEPLADSSAAPTAALARAASRSVKVALTGDGGDELFGGYDRYRAMRGLRRLAGAPRPLRALAALALEIGSRGRRRAASGARARGERLASALRAREGAGAFRAIVGLFAPEEVDALLGPGPAAGETFRSAFGEGGGDWAERAMRADFRTYLVDDLLAKVDRCTMAFALEARSPLLDARLVALARALPPEERLRGGTSKVLLRRLLARRMPPRGFEGRKRGFAIPLAAWLRGPEAGRFLDPRRLRTGGLLAAAPVERLVGEFRAGALDRGARLWALLVLARWRERTGASPPGGGGLGIPI